VSADLVESSNNKAASPARLYPFHVLPRVPKLLKLLETLETLRRATLRLLELTILGVLNLAMSDESWFKDKAHTLGSGVGARCPRNLEDRTLWCTHDTCRSLVEVFNESLDLQRERESK
jgi:hypothetical protein